MAVPRHGVNYPMDDCRADDFGYCVVGNCRSTCCLCVHFDV